MFPTRACGCLLTAAVVSMSCSSDTTTAITTDAGSGGSEAGGRAATGGVSSGTGGQPGGSGGANATGGGGARATDGGALTLSGVVEDAVPGKVGTSAESPTPDVQVCIVDSSGTTDPTIPCTQTDATGRYTLTGLPANAHLIARFSAGTRPANVIAVDTQSTDVEMPVALRLAQDGATGADFGIPADAPLGYLLAIATLVPAAHGSGNSGYKGFDAATGVAVSTSPVPAGGPFYTDAMEKGVPDAKGSAGQETWLVFQSTGNIDVTFTSTTFDCAPIPGGTAGWPNGPHTVNAQLLRLRGGH
jgi:hypothetical protein